MNRRGFTLVELLVTISVISILAGVVLAVLSDARAKARDEKRIADLRELQQGIELYYSTVTHTHPWTGPRKGWYPFNLNNLITDTRLYQFSGVSNTMPKDPLTGAMYGYTSSNSSAAASRYVLYATLERSASKPTDAATGLILGVDCDEPLRFCLTSR